MTAFSLSLILGFLPMIFYAWVLYFLDRYEKEPRRLLLGVFVWGAVIASGTALIVNSLSSLGIYYLTQSALATQFTLLTFIAPVVEETLKGLGVLLVFLVFRADFDSPLDGIIYAGIAALGFGASENVWYIYRLGYLPEGFQGLYEVAIIRTILVGWQHPFYSSFIGLGFALSRGARKDILRWGYPLLGWTLAVSTHFSHNLLTSLVRHDGELIYSIIWDWTGYLGLLFLITMFIRREQSWMELYLLPELEANIITLAQYETACSAWKQSLSFTKSLLLGNYSCLRRFYRTSGDLMHKKRQLVRQGDQHGTALEIQRLRSRLAALSAKLLQ